jgi:hypothetical protein
MKYFVILLFALSLGATAASQGVDRTITWRPWQEWAEFRVWTGDRYLGGEGWEHYLGFELYRRSTKKIKISMIYLAGEAVPDVVIAPGRRYAIVKVTNSANDCAQRPLEVDFGGGAIEKERPSQLSLT